MSFSNVELFLGCSQGSPVCDVLLVSGVVLHCVRGENGSTVALHPNFSSWKKKNNTENHQLSPFCHDSCTLKRLQRVLQNFLLSAAAASSPGAVPHLSERKMLRSQTVVWSLFYKSKKRGSLKMFLSPLCCQLVPWLGLKTGGMKASSELAKSIHKTLQKLPRLTFALLFSLWAWE